jgi:hypothetical protein
MFNKVQKYLSMSGCRREYLLRHFEEEDHDEQGDSPKIYNKFKPDCCDNCTTRMKSGSDQPDELKDFSKDAHKLLSVVSLLRSKFGLGTYISFLLGSVSIFWLNLPK